MRTRIHANHATAATLASLVLIAAVHAPGAETNTDNRWSNGPNTDASHFPIAVWLQNPRNAPKYKALGVNLYIGLWDGPTDRQIAELRRHEMPVICGQNDYALKHLDEKIIVGWMHGDEPDNAQSLGSGRGYGPPIPAERIIQDYARIKAADPTRPVLLNLGQGVAWDGWHGRGVRTNHPEDYAQYVRGGDILSFDIYPAVHSKPAVAGKLWYVARGVDRLCNWTTDEQIVWNCIECTRISNVNTRPTPQQVRAEVWMSIIHGSQGIIYFCHQFQPRFIEAGLLADEEMAAAVGQINRRIHDLAAVLRSPTLPDAATVTVNPPNVSADMRRLLGSCGVDIAVKTHQGKTYLLAVRMEAAAAEVRFELKGLVGRRVVRVLGENRQISSADGRFQDHFGPHAVHLYEVDGSVAAIR